MPEALPTDVDLLLFPRWILPVSEGDPILQDHALAVKDGLISALLSAEQARQIPARETLELPGQVLLPGLVNAHGHTAMTLLRGMADDFPLSIWLNEHIWPAEQRWVNEEFVRDGAALAMAEMLRSGTTCFSDMYFFPETAAELAHHIGVRAQFCFPIFDFPSPWGTGPDEYISKGLALRDKFKQSEFINIAFGPHAPYTVADAPLQRVVTLSAETEANIQIHLHETRAEVDEAVKSSGKRPIARLAELGLLGPRTQCVHLTEVNDEDIETLALHGCHAIHCPESNLKLASGFSPVEKMRRAGINLALGTDGAASNNDLDLLGEMRTAALLAKAVAQDASALPDTQALRMATINGARALGIDGLVGSLEAGKQADIISVDLSGLEQQPLYSPVSQLVYSNISHRVCHSWIKGKRMLDNGSLTQLDAQELAAKAEYWRKRISGD